MNEIMEAIYQWHQGQTIKGIKRSLGFDRKTIRKYLFLAQQLGVNRGEPFPSEQELLKGLKDLSSNPALFETPALNSLQAYRPQIQTWLENKHMTAKQIWRLLEEEGLIIGYSSVKRYLRREFNLGKPQVTVRIETPAGSQAQVDFGYMGMMVDPETGQLRKSWAFVMTLSYSRHRFVRFVFRMDVNNWIDCHERAFQFFGGVPETVVLDNLKPGVIKPDIYDPVLNAAYADLERHYGFVADPAKIQSPKLKGKVERTMPVIRQHFLAGRVFRDIQETNQRCLVWCREGIGQESHGTTKRRPYPVFLEEENPLLKPLPEVPFDRPLWKKCRVHPDHYIVFDRSYYSLPTRYIRQEVMARGTQKQVQIFYQHELIKTHPRSLVPGKRITDQSDFPPPKLAYLMAVPAWCRKKAAEFGPHTETLVSTLLSDHAMRNLRKAQAVLRLGEKYGLHLEAACERALAYGNTRYKSLVFILEQGLAQPESSAPAKPLSALGQSFLRPSAYFSPEVAQ